MASLTPAAPPEYSKTCARQSKNFMVTLKAIDALSSKLTEAARQLDGVVGDEGGKEEVLAKLAHDCEALGAMDSVSAEHKSYHACISKLAKAVEKQFGADVEEVCRKTRMDEKVLHSVITAHLYRRGSFKAAARFAEDTSVDVPEGMSSVLMEMHRVASALRNRDLGPAQRWAEEQRSELSAISSTLIFQLARLRFISTLQSPGVERRKEAMLFAQECLAPMASTHMREIQELMGSLLWVGHLESSPYQHLLSDNLWSAAFHTLFTDGCRVAGLPKESLLAVTFQAGTVALPTLIKMASVVRNSNQSWDDLTELPIEVPLPPSMHYHSIFSCPVSRELSTPGNPPVLLKCGHVVLRSSMSRLSRSGPKFKCPTCPTEQAEHETMVLVL